MSGKAYTMKEMKTIVDYLTEHKAYHEIKGRKMWIVLQDSKVTNRTWQSLKETFIKRILPDISNPYYKLSTEQITSFKQGYDVEARINNRLEIRSVSRDSNTDEEIKKNTEETDSCHNKKGEENKETDIRDSTETVVLENYEDPEDKQNKGQVQTKTLRELITYSEPLTPMLQVVIDDFTSDGDGSNDEPKMQIVEAPESDVIQSNEELIVVLEGSDEEKNAGDNETINNKTSDKNQIEIQPAHELTTDKDNNGETSILLDSDIPPNKEATTLGKTTNTKHNLNSQSKSSENISNSTTDTFLPGNQEALNDKDNRTKSSDKALETLKVTRLKHGKRRANSQENQTTSKKTLLDSDSEKKTNTDVDSLKKKNKKIDLKKLKMNAENDNQEESNYQNMCIDQEIAQTSKNVDENTQELENPCLKSVSLYEEQFSNKKYSDLDNTDAEDKLEKNEINADPNEKVNIPVTKNVTVSSEVNEIVMLKSNSESVSDSDQPPATTKRMSDRVRQQRDRALTKMFGFASGGVNKNRRRTSSFRKHATVRRKSHNISTDSSEWTSDTGSEYVSPPRGRKNMQTRKYLKPKSARILSLEEEGGLFVMHGKKIYPVVKDGKIIKNYVSFTPEDDVDPEESYWKLKYVEEKKRTAELTKLLNQVKDKNDREEKFPEVPSTSVHTDYIPVKREAEKNAADNIVVPDKAAQVNKVEAGAEEKTVKVKLTKNNEEVQLEGHWSHVNPVLAQVLQLLQKEPEPRGQRPSPKIDSLSEVSSVKSPTVIVNEQDVRERVNQLESKIFKEIEQIEREVQFVEKTPTLNESLPKPDEKKSDESTTKSEENTKKRKGRPRKSQMNQAENTSAKKSKLNLDVEEEKPIAARRTPRTPKNTENNNIKENSTPKTRRNIPSKMKQSNIIEDSQVKYKLPSPNKNTTTSNGKDVKNTRLRKSNSPTPSKIYSCLDMSYNSADSTHGYNDSDPSPLKKTIRKKKRLCFTYPTYRLKYRVRNRCTFLPSLTDDDSSNSYQGPTRSVTFENSSLSSNIYKSESYQHLMNNNMSLFNKNTTQKLEVINEIDPVAQQTQIMTNENNIFDLEDKSSSEQTDAICISNTNSQSSNMTLPTSPVLSIVDNISINKSIIDNFSFNEDVDMIDNDCTNKVMLNKLMGTAVDSSVPLMQQECEIDSTMQDGMEYHYNMSAPAISVVSESLLNKINTVNIEDPTSDSINDRLNDLILESNKKSRKNRFSLNKNVEQDENKKTDTKKTKTQKRSSTPRKRQSTRKLKFSQNEPCIEEEHMETCSQISRTSCPPVVQLFDEVNNNTDLSVKTNNDKRNTKSRRKKDIIKVKISKPKKKTNECVDSRVQGKQSFSSSQIDSGTNDSEFIHLQVLEDSVELIHNHSETCLNANECLEPSIEVVEDQKSIIAIDSSSSISYADTSRYPDIYETPSQELYCTDAQDGTQMNIAISDTNLRHKRATPTIFHTPLGSLSPPNSLFTEDLSSHSLSQRNRNSKWYLLSEGETTNTFDIGQIEGQSSSGANLNQIFPVTCAVPNLSTITEISKDNDENTRKLSEGTNSRNNIDL